MLGFFALVRTGGSMPKANTWKGFLFIVGATVVGVLIVQPVVEKIFQSVTGKSAENVISGGKAA